MMHNYWYVADLQVCLLEAWPFVAVNKVVAEGPFATWCCGSTGMLHTYWDVAYLLVCCIPTGMLHTYWYVADLLVCLLKAWPFVAVKGPFAT